MGGCACAVGMRQLRRRFPAKISPIFSPTCGIPFEKERSAMDLEWIAGFKMIAQSTNVQNLIDRIIV